MRLPLNLLRGNRFYLRYILDNVLPTSLISDLSNISWQNLYVVEDEEYFNAVWNDNGTEGRNTSLNTGSSPTVLEEWQNNKSAISFNGATSLKIADAVDNHSLLNVKQSVFLVGQYDQSGTSEENFLNNGDVNNNNFELRKLQAVNHPDSNQINEFDIFFKNQNFDGFPFMHVTHCVKNSDRILKFLDGGITVRNTFTSRDFGEADTLLGENLNGKIAALGVSTEELTVLQLKRIIKSCNQYYGLENGTDKHITFFGDSLTAGVSISGGQTWPHKLLTTLKSENPSTGYRFVNDAISGIFLNNYEYWNTDIYSFSNNLSVNNRVCFVWLGTNDILNSDVDEPTLTNRMISFITDRLRAGHKKIIVLTIISSTGIDGNASKLAVKNAYNSSLKAYDFSTLENQYGASIQVCDIDSRTELQDPTNTTYYLGDQLHLTSDGQQVVADYVNAFYDTADAFNAGNDISNPNFDQFEVQAQNNYVDIEFTKGLFRDSDALQSIQFSDFEIHNVTGSIGISIDSVETIDSVELIGSEKRLRFNLSITGGTPSGTETFQIKSNFDLYDVFGNVMAANTSSNTITLNEQDQPRNFGNALRYDGNNDAADWNGTVFTTPDAFSIVAWLDIDSTYPNNYSGLADGIININTVTGGSTSNWISALFLQEGSDPINDNEFVFDARSNTGLSNAARVQIPVGWEGRIMIVGRVRRKEDVNSNGDNTVNLKVKGLGKNGSDDIDDIGTITVSSSITLNNQLSRIQTGKQNGQSIKCDFVELAMVNEFLSNEQIEILWNNGLGSDEIDILSKTYHYLFNESSGTNCADEISSRDLTQINFTTVDADKWVNPIWT